MKKEFFNLEKGITELYTEKWILEKTAVKDLKNLNVKHHYWVDSNDEWWVDFDNPLENLHADFYAYRKKKHYLQPEELKKLQSDLNMNIQEFADYLKIDVAKLKQIENNQRV